MRTALSVSAVIGCLILLTLTSEPVLAAAPDTSGIPPKRLLLIFPVIVLVIIGVLLVKTRRR